MRKEITFDKILGLTFCVLAAVGAVLLLFVNAYFGGQMKLIDKYYTALERDDFEGYKACFSYSVTEEEFAKDREKILILQDNEKIHAKAEFVKRVRHYAPGEEYYVVYYDLTVYNDDESDKTGAVASLSRSNSKWVITR
ncbi:MAG: hypothetical protein K2G04_01045 [Oscillospiraceae bacterium]|nr:hypothetical protein [Oscillospiraceae bacterium]